MRAWGQVSRNLMAPANATRFACQESSQDLRRQGVVLPSQKRGGGAKCRIGMRGTSAKRNVMGERNLLAAVHMSGPEELGGIQPEPLRSISAGSAMVTGASIDRWARSPGGHDLYTCMNHFDVSS